MKSLAGNHLLSGGKQSSEVCFLCIGNRNPCSERTSGHTTFTLIIGPGGYKFGDYWRMGLPLEILIIVVSIPMILLVWPL